MTVGPLNSLIAIAFIGQSQLTFENVAQQAGIEYAHPPYQPRFSIRQAMYEMSLKRPMSLDEITQGPAFHSAGKSGVLVLDYDQDGDLDIFATNVANHANSLFQSQWAQTGRLTYIDVATRAGLAASAHNASGACHGDIDNDGDPDIFVVGDDEGHRLYENLGDGTFADITARSGVLFDSGPRAGGVGCSFGDIDNDGYLDVHIAHTWDWKTGVPCATEPFANNLRNELFHNQGDTSFVDITESSGILTLKGGDIPPGAQGLTWAQAMVDYDQDGDVDLFNLDDQCALAARYVGGLDRGLIQIWANDGLGRFSNVTEASGTAVMGQWMGIAFSDFNYDGRLDFAATSMGDYALTTAGLPAVVGNHASRWFYQQSDHTFRDVGLSDVGSSVFGWGIVAEDFDNDGDTDLFYSGGIDLTTFVAADNPDTLLVNDGTGRFSFVNGVTQGRGTLDSVQGVASDDLNGDGKTDLILASNASFPMGTPLLPTVQYGFPLDETAFFVPVMAPVGDRFVWTGISHEPGKLRVELNRTPTKYKSVSFDMMGSFGLMRNGRVNRDGVGAIVSFTPRGGQTSMAPVTGGASHVAQNSGILRFGMARSKRGTMDVLWPGGVRNRLYNVRAGTAIRFPEIPCSIDTKESFRRYARCVRSALRELRGQEIISGRAQVWYLASALRAYLAERGRGK